MRLEDMPLDPACPGKHIDPATGIWPICEWGGACQRGFVSHERFARGSEQVIKRTNRNNSRRWRQIQERTNPDGKTAL
jgi:hypothetical protein